ncbi:vitamin B12 transport system permease protein [Glaciecola punicea ACAM 611]|uniref:Vitamin B12 transport system permease protein n=1 Tax=Glaciecola punicea ACAM 611 TaxID=1121923 RepID=H5TBS9_9ALTE|nr:iron ABC transporter permease [Glaciecola punicea]OFA30893.1 heme ABC transporter permease [Glaciecola punicea]GAB55756.1 vitamin B12 transport system permease protein [Glaciecola punicea ACAM 611]
MPAWLKYSLALVIVAALYLVPALVTGNTQLEWYIVFHIKLPILLTAIAVGTSISVASAALQVNLNNPLADPGIIGISSGASLMAALFLVFVSSLGVIPNQTLYTHSIYLLPALCFVGACLSGALIYAVAKKIGHSVSSFILAGIAISTTFSALVGWIYLVAPPQALQSLTFWLMGSLQYTNYKSLSLVLPIMAFGLFMLAKSAPKLNALYLGEHAALTAGVKAKALQTKVFILVALLVGLSVSIAGSIAFLGLLVPHAVRRLHGYDNSQVFLYSGLLGAIVITLCALINEYAFTTSVPLSMLTASIGAPMFIYVLFGKKN